jgi:hypothetical protein
MGFALAHGVGEKLQMKWRGLADSLSGGRETSFHKGMFVS